LIDDIREVMNLPDSMREDNPINLDARLAQLSSGIIRLDSQLLVVLDIDRVLHVGAQIQAA
jgi:purine-binding chemotaxis protein CheW